MSGTGAPASQSYRVLYSSDYIDCGACGYDTCKEFATAVSQDLAKPDMCSIFNIQTSQDYIKTLKVTIGIRVSSEEEQEGLDIHEHGMDAYPDFALNEH